MSVLFSSLVPIHFLGGESLQHGKTVSRCTEYSENHLETVFLEIFHLDIDITFVSIASA